MINLWNDIISPFCVLQGKYLVNLCYTKDKDIFDDFKLVFCSANSRSFNISLVLVQDLRLNLHRSLIVYLLFGVGYFKYV